MKIEKLTENIRPKSNSPVMVKRMGEITEIRYMVATAGGTIKKLNRDSYVDLTTGEVKDFKRGNKTRLANIESVSRSLRNLRDIINANVTDAQKCLWVTLTYRENMTDEVRLYNDFRKYNMRLQRYLLKNGMPKSEYIAAAEPQGRGAWHLHVIQIFTNKAPYIDHSKLSELWGHGFVSISSLRDIDNVGAYLTAYLGDMDVIKEMNIVDCRNKNIKIVDAKSEENKRCKKAVIKGARLELYPTAFRIYRLSKNIKRPKISHMTEAEAMREVEGAVLTYEKTIQLKDSKNKTINRINYRQFNRRAKSGGRGKKP